MGVHLRVFLTHNRDKALLYLRTADVLQKVIDQAYVIRLSIHSYYLEKIVLNYTGLLSIVSIS